jgi:hypothetical protein
MRLSNRRLKHAKTLDSFKTKLLAYFSPDFLPLPLAADYGGGSQLDLFTLCWLL